MLGLARSADLPDIRRAYLAAARQTHPDKAGLKGAPDQIGLVYKAWQVGTFFCTLAKVDSGAFVGLVARLECTGAEQS